MSPSAIDSLSIIIPCFNESGNIKRFPTELIPHLSDYPFFIEIILIDDGSSDDTYDQMVLFQKQFPSIVLCRHATNKGLGAALQTGLKTATGEAAATLDSDLTFHPSELSKLIEAFSDEVSCVLGSPSLGRFQHVPTGRRLMSQGVNWFYHLLMGKKVTSMSSIFRLYRMKDIRAMTIRSTSFDINAEIAAKLILMGKKVKEVPVTLSSRIWGQSKINVGREIKNHLMMFVRILFWKVSGVN